MSSCMLETYLSNKTTKWEQKINHFGLAGLFFINYHKCLNEQHDCFEKSVRRCCIGSPVEDIKLEESVILNRPCLLYWNLYL